MTPTPNPTAEQIIEDALRNSYASGDALARLIVSALRAHGLLSEPVQGNAKLLQNSAPSEEQIANGVREADLPCPHLSRGESRRRGECHRCAVESGWSVALAAAGVAPQEPQSLDAEKVAATLFNLGVPSARIELIASDLCVAYTEGKLTC